MSMFNDIVWDAKGNENYVKTIQKTIQEYAEKFPAIIGLSQGLDLRRSGTELTIANQMDLGIERQRTCF